MKNKKKLLILGGSGFIGRNLVNFFSKQSSYEVISTYFKSKKPKVKNVKWIKCDLRNEKAVKKITKNIKIIIQAAATTSGSKDIVNKPYIHVTDNAVMNSLILRSCFENKIQHLIFFSCTVMYNSSLKPLKENDFDPNKGIHPRYFGVANTKVYIEKMCEFYSRISETKFTCVRHSNIYGPHDKYDLDKSHFFGATIAKVAKANDYLKIWGDGSEKRDLLYIDDLVHFVSKAIINQKRNFRIYNCGLGKCYSVMDVTKKIIKKFNKNKIKIKTDKTKPSIKTFLSLNNNLAKKEINWIPKIDLDKGITKTIKWYNKYYG